MIYEMRIYNFKPGGAVGQWEQNFLEAYQGTRDKYSKLGGMWHTEFGPLNQAIHIWQYDSLQQRADIRAAAAKDPSGKWPPKGADLIVSQEVHILNPLKNSPVWTGEPQELGGVWELRQYTYAPGNIGKVATAFNDAIPARQEIYPIGGIFTSDLGELNRLYQLFPYKDWNHRDEVRGVYQKTHVWPPHAEVSPVHQLVRHMIPAKVSPLH